MCNLETLTWQQSGLLMCAAMIAIAIAAIVYDCHRAAKRHRRLAMATPVTSPRVSRAWLRACKDGRR